MPTGHRVQSGSREFTQAELGVVGFVSAWVHLGATGGRLIHSRSRGFTRARLRFIRVRVGSLGCD